MIKSYVFIPDSQIQEVFSKGNFIRKIRATSRRGGGVGLRTRKVSRHG